MAWRCCPLDELPVPGRALAAQARAVPVGSNGRFVKAWCGQRGGAAGPKPLSATNGLPNLQAGASTGGSGRTGLVHVRVGPVQVMVKLPPLGRVNIQFPQISGGCPSDVAGFVIDGRVTLNRLGQQDDLILLPYLAVTVGDDVGGIGEDTEYACHLHKYARFFPGLADGALAGGLT